MFSIAIFVSGSGTNCENIIRWFAGRSDVRVALVVSNRPDAYALVRAGRHGVPTAVLTRRQINDPAVILPLLESYDISLIVLAGFMLMIPSFLVDSYPRRIINIHPSLLPRHGGKGMYGHHVHQAVKDAGDTVSGITVHYVSDVCDGGEIIAQFSTPVSPDDTPDDIERKVRALEIRRYPEVIEQVINQVNGER